MNLDEASRHYATLKACMRDEAPADLAWYERGTNDGYHYTSIDPDNYLRLFFRVVWTSGFRAQTVFDKEASYFEVLYRHFPAGQFNTAREDSFLREVAPILGGHAGNRKNKAVVHLLRLLSSMGWTEFRRRYITPHPTIESDLDALPMIGPTTVRLLLNQTGIRDIAKNDIWVTRFAHRHGFAQPDHCVALLAARTGDSQTTIDAVLFWAGRKYSLDPPAPNPS